MKNAVPRACLMPEICVIYFKFDAKLYKIRCGGQNIHYTFLSALIWIEQSLETNTFLGILCFSFAHPLCMYVAQKTF